MSFGDGTSDCLDLGGAARRKRASIGDDDDSRSSRQSVDRARSSRASADHHRLLSEQARIERVRAQQVVVDQQREMEQMEAALADARRQLDDHKDQHDRALRYVEIVQSTVVLSAQVEGRRLAGDNDNGRACWVNLLDFCPSG